MVERLHAGSGFGIVRNFNKWRLFVGVDRRVFRGELRFSHHVCRNFLVEVEEDEERRLETPVARRLAMLDQIVNGFQALDNWRLGCHMPRRTGALLLRGTAILGRVVETHALGIMLLD